MVKENIYICQIKALKVLAYNVFDSYVKSVFWMSKNVLYSLRLYGIHRSNWWNNNIAGQRIARMIVWKHLGLVGTCYPGFILRHWSSADSAASSSPSWLLVAPRGPLRIVRERVDNPMSSLLEKRGQNKLTNMSFSTNWRNPNNSAAIIWQTASHCLFLLFEVCVAECFICWICRVPVSGWKLWLSNKEVSRASNRR